MVFLGSFLSNVRYREKADARVGMFRNGLEYLGTFDAIEKSAGFRSPLKVVLVGAHTYPHLEFIWRECLLLPKACLGEEERKFNHV